MSGKILLIITIISLMFTNLFAKTDSLKIQWLSNPEPNISHYILYRSVNTLTDFQQCGSVSHPNNMFVDNNLIKPGKLYSYTLVAVDSSGMSSDYSDTVSVGIPKVKLNVSNMPSGQETIYSPGSVVRDRDNLISELTISFSNATNIIGFIQNGDVVFRPDPLNFVGTASITVNVHDPDSLNDSKNITIEFDGPTDINKLAHIPEKFLVEQNYPNPFNPTTTIPFQLAERGQVKIDIYNTLGQHVKGLINTEMNRGMHQVAWDGTNEFQQPVSSGIYIYSVIAGENRTIKRMQLLK